MASLNRDHRGEKAAAAGDRIKALLEPLEPSAATGSGAATIRPAST